MKIGRTWLFHVFLRSFFIQGTWNFERMQNVGFAFTIAPALRRMGRGSVERHLEYFNTHPYMASPIAGAVIGMEEEGLKEGEIEAFKKALMGPCGAIGDSFFWGAWRPFSSMVAVTLTIRHWDVWAPLIFLILYNLPHLWIRWKGLVEGYRRRKGVVRYIEGLGMPHLAKRVRYLTIVLLSLFLALLLRGMLDGGDAGLLAPGILGLVLLTGYLLRRGVSPGVMVYSYSLLWVGWLVLSKM